MQKFVVKVRERETEMVRAMRASSVDEAKRAFTEGGIFSHLELLSIYDFGDYVENFEQKVEYANGMVRFGERAFQDKRNVGEFN